MLAGWFVALTAWSCGGAVTSPSGAPPTAAVATARPTTSLPTSLVVGDLVAQFAYDRTAPLAVRETASSRSGALAVTEVEYTNGRGTTAKATLIIPSGEGRRPALLMSPGSNQSRGDMKAEALDYANTLGVIVLVVDQSQIAAGRDKVWTFTAQDREEAIESVIDLRRGIDVLSARADVDPSRIGASAFSYGAWLTVIAAAADPRLALLVLRSGGPQILRELAGPTRAATPEFAAYADTMRTVDQLRYAPAIAPSVPVLVQNGAADTTYPADGVRAWQGAIGGTKTARMYDGAGHTLNATATADALAFIRERWR